MAFGAAGSLYITLADLTPFLHRRLGIKHTPMQLVFILAGISTIRGFISIRTEDMAGEFLC